MFCYIADTRAGFPRYRFRTRGRALPEPETDRATLAQVGAGSERAFLSLVERHHASLIRVARLWLAEPAAAEELVRATWMHLLRRMDRFDAQASLKAWLCAALVELVRARPGFEAEDFTRVAALDEAPAVDPARFSPVGDRWEGHWQKPPTDWPGARAALALPDAASAELERAIDALPHAERVLVVLRDLEGLSSHEVQTVLGAGEVEQRVLLHRGRSRLRAALERHYEEPRGAA